MELKVYNSLDKLKFVLFWEILKTRNPLLLDIDYNEKKTYTEEEQKYIIDVWSDLYDKFHLIKNDQKTKNLLNSAMTEIKLQHKINTLISNYNFLLHLESVKTFVAYDEYLKMQKELLTMFSKIEPRIKVKLMLDLDYNLKLVKSVISALETQLNLKKNKIEDKANEQIESVYKLVVRVEQILERSIPNINEISVSQWIEYEKIANEKISSIKNGKQR